MKASVIIVAAGSSTRMGKPISKQLIKLNETEVIVHRALPKSTLLLKQQPLQLVVQHDRSLLKMVLHLLRSQPNILQYTTVPDH